MATSGLQLMHADPAHHFDWRIRRQIYELFSPHSYPFGLRARRYLPILTAEHVLPIFSTRFPDEDLPRRLINAALTIADGSLKESDPRTYALLDEGYHAMGGFMAFDEKTEMVVCNAHYTAFSTYKALLEVHSLQDPWLHADKLSKSGNLYSFGAAFDPHIGSQGGEFTDEDWASLVAAGDAAAPAAMAFATSEASPNADPAKLEQFWVWWVEVALPRAWERSDS